MMVKFLLQDRTSFGVRDTAQKSLSAVPLEAFSSRELNRDAAALVCMQDGHVLIIPVKDAVKNFGCFVKSSLQPANLLTS